MSQAREEPREKQSPGAKPKEPKQTQGQNSGRRKGGRRKKGGREHTQVTK